MYAFVYEKNIFDLFQMRNPLIKFLLLPWLMRNTTKLTSLMSFTASFMRLINAYELGVHFAVRIVI